MSMNFSKTNSEKTEKNEFGNHDSYFLNRVLLNRIELSQVRFI